MTTPRPVVLCILDGWGIGTGGPEDAPAQADTPNFDALMAQGPMARLVTYGPDVGLPTGQMGNSEVGHMNIGAGRIVPMDLGRIDLAIEDGSFATHPALVAFADKLLASGGTAHLLGLVSDGGVHGHITHLIHATRILSDRGVPVAIHALTDGRDVAPGSAAASLKALTEALPKGARIATVAGRYWAMDRDQRWDRIEKAYAAIVEGRAAHQAVTARDADRAARGRGESDEFYDPTVIGGYTGMTPADGLFCLNFRADRAREILSAIADSDFDRFPTQARPALTARLGMADYSERHDRFFDTMFPKHEVRNTLGAWVAAQGLSQFHIAETEKYPHVTFFLNGGREQPEPGEDRFMPASPDVPTYDLKPEMSSVEVTDHLVAAIQKGYDLIVVNFANPDMVGHTGSIPAAIRACEAVDAGLGRVLEATRACGGAVLVTADHGNCDMMIDPDTGAPHTAHTLNPVPVLLDGGPKGAALADGRLADLAPTVLDLMGLTPPPEMTGKSLIR